MSRGAASPELMLGSPCLLEKAFTRGVKPGASRASDGGPPKGTSLGVIAEWAIDPSDHDRPTFPANKWPVRLCWQYTLDSNRNHSARWATACIAPARM